MHLLFNPKSSLFLLELGNVPLENRRTLQYSFLWSTMCTTRKHYYCALAGRRKPHRLDEGFLAFVMFHSVVRCYTSPTLHPVEVRSGLTSSYNAHVLCACFLEGGLLLLSSTALTGSSSWLSLPLLSKGLPADCSVSRRLPGFFALIQYSAADKKTPRNLLSIQRHFIPALTASTGAAWHPSDLIPVLSNCWHSDS